MNFLSGMFKTLEISLDDAYDDGTLCIEDTEDAESIILDLSDWDELKTNIDEMINEWSKMK